MKRSRPANHNRVIIADVASEALPVISLFSGGGGLDLAAERCADLPGEAEGEIPSPLRVAVATDYDADTITTLEANFECPTICADIREVSARDLLATGGIDVGEAGLVIGGPPCTPFSKSGYWLDYKREGRDPNASLLDDYARVVLEAQPEAFVLENVQGLTYRTHAAQFRRLIDQLSDYNPQWRVLNAADYGVPQLRKRVFLVGLRSGEPFVFPEPTHAGWTEHTTKFDQTKRPYVTSKEVIGDLAGADPEPGELVEGQWGEVTARIPPGENYLWHTERGGGEPLFKWRSRYWTFLLRIDPDRPSTTLQAQPGPYVGPFHWENLPNEAGELRARRLRVPEMKRLMTFPDDFVLPHSRRVIQRQLGNAVPVDLGKIVVRTVMEQLGRLPKILTPNAPVQLTLD